MYSHYDTIFKSAYFKYIFGVYFINMIQLILI